MAVAGRVAIVPKDNYDASKTYKRLDAVMHNNTLYIAKQDVPAGKKPGSGTEEYWMGGPSGGVGVPATADKIGSVKPDGKTVSTDPEGTLSVNLDGDTITLDQARNVIKLADTLKEKINGAFLAANVTNNQVTTEAGFALDARQANPNITGTLGAQIAAINSNLSKTISKIKYPNSSNGVTIQFSGTAFIIIYQGGALGAAIYFINSTSYAFEYTKISDTLKAYPITISSVDKASATFKIEWATAGYFCYLIPL